ncbi:MAG: FAD:protein FMN transferase [Eubacterium sp.]|nr:FAD:protein FMN transferase [Eubacterium sp.]
MKKIISAALLLMLLLMTGCGALTGSDSATGDTTASGSATDVADDEEFSQQVFAMDTYMTVTAYGPHGEEAVDQATAEIERLDSLFSVGDENSDISKVNAAGGGTVSSDTAYLIARSGELYDMTGGLFDISVYPLMDLWGFTTLNYQVPDEASLADALALVDGSAVNVDEETGEVSFDIEGMEIDLGGIAKGYTSGRIMEIFEDCGVESGLVSLGGNVQLYGSKTDGSDWRIAIQNPDADEDYIAVVETSDKAIITSGGYERYFEEDGVVYHHIVDPTTGYPADSGLQSVSIVSADGTLADGLSTALFIMGLDDAIAFYQAHSQAFDIILYTDDGELYVSEGIADCVSSPLGLDIQVVSAE